MFRRRILPLALWVQLAIAFGSDMLELKTGSEMVSLSDAAVNDILLPDTVSNFTELFEDNNQLQSFGLHARQRQCVDPGYYPCSNGVRCCPGGDTCVSGGCCRGNTQLCGSSKCYDPSSQICCSSGIACSKGKTCVEGGCCNAGESKCGSSACYDPKTSVCCGSSGTHCPKGATCCTGPGTVWACDKGDECCATRGCANPATEKCCKNGGCEKGTTCCENECCRSSGYCGSDGYCKACPVPTSTITSTYAFTTTAMKTVRVTDDIEPDTGNAPEFSCVPMTATNDVGATLELDTGCVLHYEPPGETSTGGRARRDIEAPTAAPVPIDRGLLARQASCNPSTTYTSTIWKTEVYTRTGTQTVTVAGEDATFSCPEMEVTNDVGDTLALDEECVLSFSPAEPTDSDGLSAQGGRQGGSQAGGGSTGPTAAAGGGNDSAGSFQRVQMFLTVGFVMASVLCIAL
ncbi:unnamed protein product [Fusarium equiseti]|uniref:GPI anchored protein n=1 Tax=Fusarium equiseti TaxID=61235 RepID=A0A8J2IPB5_FUSEQ|nr:unnamed protein product [Fusarium equiseti]